MNTFKPMVSVNVAQAAQPKGRRQWIVEPRFQYGFLAWMVTLSLVVTGLIYGANYYFFYTYEQRGLQSGLSPDHPFFQALQLQRMDMNLIFVVVSLVCMGFMTLMGLILSHRVAGPVYKIRKHLDAVAKGETIQDVTFRKRDYFPELAETVNRMLAPIRAQRKKSGSRGMKPRAASMSMRVG